MYLQFYGILPGEYQGDLSGIIIERSIAESIVGSNGQDISLENISSVQKNIMLLLLYYIW